MSITYESQVGNGVSQPSPAFVTVDGVRYVAKGASHWEVEAEMLATYVAPLVGVHVPDGFALPYDHPACAELRDNASANAGTPCSLGCCGPGSEPAETWLFSKFVKGQHAKFDTDDLTSGQAALAARLVAFDLLISNEDRHMWNFVRRGRTAYAIDHAFAFMDCFDGPSTSGVLEHRVSAALHDDVMARAKRYAVRALRAATPEWMRNAPGDVERLSTAISIAQEYVAEM